MSRIAYVNGAYVAHDDARVHIEDRGYQFADGIYEVCLVINGHYWDLAGHLARMARSLNELSIAPPVTDNSLIIIMKEILRQNRLRNALVYLQATRGVAPRNHFFPDQNISPSLIVTARRFNLDTSDGAAEKGARAITYPDIRWGRVDIKSISLLPNVLAKQAAREAGALEAWLVRDGFVTEGSSSNTWILTPENRLVTHPKTNAILGGITRQTTLSCAQKLGLEIEERPFSLEEALSAKEAFITSATSLVMPIVAIDDHRIGEGTPGPTTQKLREAYKSAAAGL